MTHPPTNLYQQGFKVFLVVVFAAAISGFFSGMRPPTARSVVEPPAADESASTAEKAHDVLPAASYAELPNAKRGPNRDYRSSLEALPSPEPVSSRKKYPRYTKDDVIQALADRAERRAFDGAPPVVPHPIAQMSTASCLSCHGEGKKVGDRHAPKICHEPMANCTQCHVEGHRGAESPIETLANHFGENEFIGLEAPLHGPRATRAAPPMIPHSTWMRTDCLSCHGPTGKNAIQTRHPYRQNCTQCHAPSAQQEQQPVSPSPAPRAERSENPLRR